MVGESRPPHMSLTLHNKVTLNVKAFIVWLLILEIDQGRFVKLIIFIRRGCLSENTLGIFVWISERSNTRGRIPTNEILYIYQYILTTYCRQAVDRSELVTDRPAQYHLEVDGIRTWGGIDTLIVDALIMRRSI